MTVPPTQADVDHYRTFGFVVLRGALDPRALGDELDRALGDAAGAPFGTGVARAQYVPMMVASTPSSLALLDRFEGAAAALLGGPVLPVRAKGVRYFGSTSWHADSSDEVVVSVGFAAYLEPLGADSGALRVVPGSHRADFGRSVLGYVAALGEGAPVEAVPATAVETEPGDVIAFDEHLVHASTGGSVRRQWRVDYVRAPRSERENVAVRAYFERIFAADWDGGYDVDRFPSYGADWLGSGRPAVERLRALGVYERADAHEAFACSRRSARRT